MNAPVYHEKQHDLSAVGGEINQAWNQSWDANNLTIAPKTPNTTMAPIIEPECFWLQYKQIPNSR